MLSMSSWTHYLSMKKMKYLSSTYLELILSISKPKSIKETILGEEKQVSASTFKAAVERQHHRRAITTLEDSGVPSLPVTSKKRSTRKSP